MFYCSFFFSFSDLRLVDKYLKFTRWFLRSQTSVWETEQSTSILFSHKSSFCIWLAILPVPKFLKIESALYGSKRLNMQMNYIYTVSNRIDKLIIKPHCKKLALKLKLWCKELIAWTSKPGAICTHIPEIKIVLVVGEYTGIAYIPRPSEKYVS